MLLSNINIRRLGPRVLSKTPGFKPEPSASAHTVSVHRLNLYIYIQSVTQQRL